MQAGGGREHREDDTWSWLLGDHCSPVASRHHPSPTPPQDTLCAPFRLQPHRAPHRPLCSRAPSPLSSLCLGALQPPPPLLQPPAPQVGMSATLVILAVGTGPSVGCVQDVPEGLLGLLGASHQACSWWGAWGVGLQHLRSPRAWLVPVLLSRQTAHCCPFCGRGTETQERPALAPNRAAGEGRSQRSNPVSDAQAFPRTSEFWTEPGSREQAGVVLAAGGAGGGGWPERGRVQWSHGTAPTPTGCAQTGILRSLQARGIFGVSVASSWWRWSGEGPCVGGGRGRLERGGGLRARTQNTWGAGEASCSPEAWNPAESSWLGPAFCKQI